MPAMLSALREAAIVLDPQGVIVAANELARTGLSVLVGGHISQAVRLPDLLSAMRQVRETGEQHDVEVKLSVPVERLLDVSIAPLGRNGSDSRAALLLVVLRDRTEELQLAEMRADFVANASHELRTPLASLKGFIETLQGAAKDDPAARERFLSIMQEQADRMTRLIDDLLSLSRIEMHEHVLPSQTVDVAEIAATIGKALLPVAAKEGRHLSVSLPERAAPVIGDRDELLQVVQNLAQNAIKYGRKGGRLDVTVQHMGSQIVLRVADDGIGIAPEHLPRLTERFYRVSAKESRERGGTGLGLAIVKHIVNRHRGELKIESQLGKGSTFAVLLPAAEPRF